MGDEGGQGAAWLKPSLGSRGEEKAKEKGKKPEKQKMLFRRNEAKKLLKTKGRG